jgi:hypothetical protein
MEEAPENGKEFPHSAHANGMNESINEFIKNSSCDYSLLHLKNLYTVTRISLEYYCVTPDYMKKRMINQ